MFLKIAPVFVCVMAWVPARAPTVTPPMVGILWGLSADGTQVFDLSVSPELWPEFSGGEPLDSLHMIPGPRTTASAKDYINRGLTVAHRCPVRWETWEVTLDVDGAHHFKGGCVGSEAL